MESEAINDGRPVTTSGHVNRVKGLAKGKSAQNLPKSSQGMAVSKSTPNFRPGTESKSRGTKRSAFVEEVEPEVGALPESTAITAGLLRIADILSRKVLPWQAAFCPRAVEHLRDGRSALVSQKHEGFIMRMTKQLEDKVLEFLNRKDEEVDTWVQLEVDKWQQAMLDEEDVQNEFYEEDEARLCKRTGSQEDAARMREMTLAAQLDEQEREATREQLVNFRRLCRTETKADVRALHASIEGAKTKAAAQTTVSSRDLLRRQEEAHDWLCCVSDNAVTAQESEIVLKRLYQNLDKERSRALTSLQSALTAYKSQYEMIFDAIAVFQGKVHQHANDYLRREQLVSRGFLQYLTSIISGEIKPHTSESRKTNVAWEGKFTVDRSLKRDSQLLADFNSCLQPFEQKVDELRTRMKVQKDHITVKMQSILNGRDNDVSKRKATIHKKLAKHVKRVCNDRRVRLKDAAAARLEEYALEEQCVNAVSGMISDLRNDIDQIWVKEHIRERRMYEAVAGRMERLEKSSLLIWNRHAHMAVSEKEDYRDWLEAFTRSRDHTLNEVRLRTHAEYKQWRKSFTTVARTLIVDMKRPLKRYIQSAQDFNVKVSLDENLLELEDRRKTVISRTKEIIGGLGNALEGYITKEMNKMNEFYRVSREHQLQDWQVNLHRLNNGINRRVGSLKGMEKDLEETIRMTLAQHEIEACVFEQSSCSRIEMFWIHWRDKVATLGKTLKESMEDFRIAKSTDRIKVRGTAKDRAFDELLSHPELANGPALTPLKSLRKHGSSSFGVMDGTSASNTAQLQPPLESTIDDSMLSDTSRLKAILDEVRTEAYVDFTRNSSRGFEVIRKNHGEGRRRTVPPFMISKVVISAADAFWERAKLSERCVGRVTSRGMRVFMSGLPRYARALFCLSAAMCTLANIPMRDGTRIDPDEVVAYFEQGVKRIFLVALMTITIQYGTFGEYFLQQECIWACTSCQVFPPVEAHDIDIDFASNPCVPDPIDILNSLLSIPEFASEKVRGESNFALGGDVGHCAEDEVAELTAHDGGYMEGANANATASSAINKLVKSITLKEFMVRMGNVAPIADIAVLLSLLGRHGDIVEVSYARFSQAVYIWRKVAIAMLTASLDPPGAEYTRLMDSINLHVVTKAGKRKVGLCDVACISPFEAVTSTLDWISSIRGAPLSMLQALGMVTRSGNVDPWLEDLKQSVRASRFTYELTELLDSYVCKDYQNSNEHFPASFPGDIENVIRSFDVNGSGIIPLELLRSYVQKDDAELSNAQISCVYWSINRCTGEAESYLVSQQKDDDAIGSVVPEPYAVDFASTSASSSVIVKRSIRPEFGGDVESYVEKFRSELGAVIETMPQLDTNVVVGLLSAPLNPVDAHQIVSDAMKLDVSARNNVPSTTSVWLGMRSMQLDKAIETVSIPNKLYNFENVQYDDDGHPMAPSLNVGPGMLLEANAHARAPTQVSSSSGSYKYDMQHKTAVGNLLFGDEQGVVTTSPLNPMANEAFVACRLLEIRMHVEIELLTKLPVICERRASDMSYGAGGSALIAEDHFQELMKRRLDRIDKLTIAWRSTMMNEWATSLYQSRKERYGVRAEVVKNCIKVYQEQYAILKRAIVDERIEVMNNYSRLVAESAELERQDHVTMRFHTDFLQFCICRFTECTMNLVKLVDEALIEFQTKCGVIKRKALQRVKVANDSMKYDLEMSCKGLIDGYTGGYAQHHFDELLYRGERWRTNFTVFHGTIIVSKENFVKNKIVMDNEVMQQITDRISLDRNRTKKLLERLNNESLFFHESLNTIKANFAELQKDTNQRIMLRIERAVRESKKLRVAGEKDAQLEKHVLAEIRMVLGEARTACMNMVNTTTETCTTQLKAVEPRRVVHRARMEDRVREAQKGWDELNELLSPLAENYEISVKQTMGVLKSKCMDSANQYRDEEIALLSEEYVAERKILIRAFREHFTEYDLSEAMIFEKFNMEVNGAVSDIRSSWGSSSPPWIKKLVMEGKQLSSKYIGEVNEVVVKDYFEEPQRCDDDTVMIRMEIADTLANCMKGMEDMTSLVPEMYNDEKRLQITQIKNMGMKNNNDMIRPQVIAVMDLLLSGIQIDNDFELGYEALKTATRKKCDQINVEVSDFIDKYLDPLDPVSITFTANQCNSKIAGRSAEVKTMIDASNTHIVADHSKLDVEVQQGFSDIEQWTELTSQLVRGAFDTSVEKYLAPIWPSPESTPRDENYAPEEIDRVEKIKTLLMANYEANLVEENNAIIKDEDLGKLKDPSTTRELQEGWLECCTEDMVVYYFNQESGESLWDLPAALKIPKYPDPDPSGAGYLETPRELVVGEFAASQTVPTEVAIVAAKHTKRFRGDVDVTMLITDVMGLANVVVNQSIDTAVEITSVLKNPDNVRPPTPDDLPDVLNDEEEGGIADYLSQLVGKDEFELLKQEREEKTREQIAATANDSPDAQLAVTQSMAGSILTSAQGATMQVGDSDVGNEWLKYSMGVEDDDEDEAQIRANEAATSAQARSKKSVVKQAPSNLLVASTVEDDLLKSIEGHDEDIVNDGAVMGSGSSIMAASNKTASGVFNIVSTKKSDVSENIAEVGAKVDAWIAENFPVGVEVSEEEAIQAQFEMKQQVYRMARENDGMMNEDALAQAIRNLEQNRLMERFDLELDMVLKKDRIHQENVDNLKTSSTYMHEASLNSVFAKHHSSWNSLNDRVAATLLILQKEKDEAEATRQATIKELHEDIEEMYDFFRKVGLSKTISKKTATECIANQLTTAKKLAKVWSRQGITTADLKLDPEDAEEVEAALKQLILETQGGSFSDLNWYENSIANKQQQDQLQLENFLQGTGSTTLPPGGNTIDSEYQDQNYYIEGAEQYESWEDADGGVDPAYNSASVDEHGYSMTDYGIPASPIGASVDSPPGSVEKGLSRYASYKVIFLILCGFVCCRLLTLLCRDIVVSWRLD